MEPSGTSSITTINYYGFSPIYPYLFRTTKNKSDAGENRDRWAYFQLGQFIEYKVAKRGRQTHIRPAPYTSKSDHRNGILGKRDKHQFIGFDGYQCNADWNAGFNLSLWDGFACPLGLYVPAGGVLEDPQSFASDSLEVASMQRE